MENSKSQRFTNMLDGGGILVSEGKGAGFASYPWILPKYERALDLIPMEVYVIHKALMHNWDARGVAWFSVNKMAKSAIVSAKTIRKYQKSIQEKGYFDRDPRKLPIYDRRIRWIVSGLYTALAFCVLCDPNSKYYELHPFEKAKNAYDLIPNAPEDFRLLTAPIEVNEYAKSHNFRFNWGMLQLEPLNNDEEKRFTFICERCFEEFDTDSHNAKFCPICRQEIQGIKWEEFIHNKNSPESHQLIESIHYGE